jgi:hypothetical protein
LPTELAHIAGIARLIAPAASRVLRFEGIADGAADPFAQARIARHCIRFAERQSGDAVAVHGSEQLGISLQASVCCLTSQQKLQAVLNLLAIVAVEMRVASTEHGEQRQTGDSRVSPGSSASSVVTQQFRFPPCPVLIGVPATIRTLVSGEPLQSSCDGGFGRYIATMLLGHFDAVSSNPGGVQLWHCLAIA